MLIMMKDIMRIDINNDSCTSSVCYGNTSAASDDLFDDVDTWRL